MKTIIKFLFVALVVWVAAKYLSGVAVDGYRSALIAAVVLGIINSFIKPILQIISIPITIITFGLFLLVINAGMVMMMDYFVGGFKVSSFWWALLMSFIVSIATSMAENMVGEKQRQQLH